MTVESRWVNWWRSWWKVAIPALAMGLGLWAVIPKSPDVDMRNVYGLYASGVSASERAEGPKVSKVSENTDLAIASTNQLKFILKPSEGPESLGFKSSLERVLVDTEEGWRTVDVDVETRQDHEFVSFIVMGDGAEFFGKRAGQRQIRFEFSLSFPDGARKSDHIDQNVQYSVEP